MPAIETLTTQKQQPVDSQLSIDQHNTTDRSNDDSSSKLSSVVRWVVALIAVAFFGWLIATGRLTMDHVNQFAADLPNWLFVPAYLILPLIGFPISAMLLPSGLKYGFWIATGMAVAVMAFHTFAAWHVTHGFLRERIQRLLKSTRFDLPKIPEDHQIWMTLVFVTVPGLPYWVKLYSLALTNLSFGRYFTLVWLGHATNSILFIGMGAAAADVNPWVLAGLAVLAVGSGFAMKRVRERFNNDDADSEPDAAVSS